MWAKFKVVKDYAEICTESEVEKTRWWQIQFWDKSNLFSFTFLFFNDMHVGIP